MKFKLEKENLYSADHKEEAGQSSLEKNSNAKDNKGNEDDTKGTEEPDGAQK
jgi:hypothetical protein